MVRTNLYLHNCTIDGWVEKTLIALDLHVVSISVREYHCCADTCSRNIDYATLLVARKMFTELSVKSQNQWILEYVTITNIPGALPHVK